MWMPGLLAASGFFGCSLQNFDYLTANPDAGITGASGAPANGLPDGATSGNGGAPVDSGLAGTDGTSAHDGGDGGTPIGPSNLVNPGFEQGYTGWHFSPSTAMGKYAYTQYAPTGGTTVDGLSELATWSMTDSFTVKVFQSLSNVPSGTYTFTGNFNCGVNNVAYLYAANCGGPDQRADIVQTAATSWEAVTITGIEITSGTCEVGFYVDASPSDWLNADAFSFVMAGPLAPSDDAGAGSDDAGAE